MRLTALVCLLLVGCQMGTHDEDEDNAAPVPQRVAADGAIHLTAAEQDALGLKVAPAKQGALPDVKLFYGVVRAASGSDVEVTSPVDGRIAAPPRVALGVQVPAGAALLEVAPTLAAGERVALGVQGAEAMGQIAAAEKELSVQQAALARAQELAQSRIVSAEKVQQAEAAVAATRARLQALRISHGLQSTGGGRPIPLTAPIAGTVVQLRSDVGGAVKSGDLLAEVLAAGGRTVDVALPPGFPPIEGCEVEASGTWAPARLVFAGATVEKDGARHARLELADRPGLLPGATVAVRVAVGSSAGLILPETAVVPAPAGDLVYVRSAADTFRPVPVQVAARFQGQVRVASGLAEGAAVVVTGAMALRGEALRSQLQQGD